MDRSKFKVPAMVAYSPTRGSDEQPGSRKNSSYLRANIEVLLKNTGGREGRAGGGREEGEGGREGEGVVEGGKREKEGVEGGKREEHVCGK